MRLSFFLMFLLSVMLFGCWKMQALPEGSSGSDTDSDGDTDSDSDGDTDTNTYEVDPHLTCNVDIVLIIDSSQSMMNTVHNLVQDGFAGFTNMMSSYPTPGTIRLGVTNHLYGFKTFEGTTFDAGRFMTEGWPMGAPHDINLCDELQTVPCDFASGEVWMEGPSSTLSQELTCVGNIPCQEDTSEGEERTLQAGLEALICPENQGFLRDDALLFMIFISDENDGSPLSPEEIREGIIQVKGQGELALEPEEYVYVATVGGNNSSECTGDFFGQTDPTPRQIQFSQLFGANGAHYNMCTMQIETALSYMTATMTNACEEVFDMKADGGV